MAGKHLATYLNDHLAGAVTAVELLEHLEKEFKGTVHAPFLLALRSDISADLDELIQIMERAGVAQSGPRKAAGWFSEKLAEIKLKLDDKSSGEFHLFEGMEVIAVGIDGKRALWAALKAVSDSVAGLQEIDFDRLQQRADEQRSRVEGLRIESAKAALT